MVLPVIRGNKMEGYITRAKACSQEFVELTAEGTTEAAQRQP